MNTTSQIHVGDIVEINGDTSTRASVLAISSDGICRCSWVTSDQHPQLADFPVRALRIKPEDAQTPRLINLLTEREDFDGIIVLPKSARTSGQLAILSSNRLPMTLNMALSLLREAIDKAYKVFPDSI